MKMQYREWKIEVAVLPATDGGWGQLTTIVSRSEGNQIVETSVSPSGDAFPNEQAALEDGVMRTKLWIDNRG